MSLRRTPLMVTKYGDHAIGMIVRIQFLLHRSILGRALVQLLLESYGCVISTKHLGSQALHIRCKVFVELRGLKSSELVLRQRV